ncbi:MAG TPA: hypothetical protein VFU43_17455 [Streptosporangiaceae bacterium]|nr:hypothetical protein [Streptosporangiaceae bacterium]
MTGQDMTGEGMTMDLENELRQAMAEHVADVSAPESLAAAARRGYHRTVRVRALTVTAAAAAVVAIAAMPAYQAFRPETVGSPGRAPSGTPAGGLAPSAPEPARAPATPSTPARSSEPAARPGTAAPPAAPSGHGGRSGRSLLTYLPSGLRQVAPCATTKTADRQITLCRWTGSGGLIEVKLIRGPSFAGPSDIGYLPPMSIPARVHDRPAIRGEWPDVGSQVSWVEHSGLGVWVGVGRALDNKLMRIAEGVRVTS